MGDLEDYSNNAERMFAWNCQMRTFSQVCRDATGSGNFSRFE